MIYLHCSKCKEVLEAPADISCKTIICPKCKNQEQVPDLLSKDLFKCPKCGSFTKAAGRREFYKCIYCGYTDNTDSRLINKNPKSNITDDNYADLIILFWVAISIIIGLTSNKAIASLSIVGIFSLLFLVLIQISLRRIYKLLKHQKR